MKNIPENNARLWKIKHLIKIAPITFPDGIPTEEVLNCTYLKENGELVINKTLNPSNDVLEATEKFISNPKKLDVDTLRRNSHKKWNLAWDTSL